MCCWVEETKVLVSFLLCCPQGCPQGGSMQSLTCGYVHKNDRPEHRSICRELTSSHSSLPQTSDVQVSSLGAGTPIMPWRPLPGDHLTTPALGDPRCPLPLLGTPSTLQTSETCRYVPIPLLCFSVLNTNTSSWNIRACSAVLMRRYHSSKRA